MTPVKIRKRVEKFAEPLLRRVLLEAENEHRQFEDAFRLLGWDQLPENLKLAIRDDVKAYADELTGKYSTCDPYVFRRRKSVAFWVNCYQENICSLDTAVKSLEVKKL